MVNSFAPALRLSDAEHGIVYRNDAEFCGWPFICGFWTAANGDYLVAFQKKPADYSDPSDINHDHVAKVGPKIVTIRSTDRGWSWDKASMQVLFDLGTDQDALFVDKPDTFCGCRPWCKKVFDPSAVIECGLL